MKEEPRENKKYDSSKKIRILHVSQADGGVDRYLRMLFKYMDRDRYENILICSQKFSAENYKGLVSHFEQLEMHRKIGFNDLQLIHRIRKLIKKYEPDVVYAHSSKAGAVVRVADIGLKNYCVYNPHGWAFNMNISRKKQAIYCTIEKIASPFCDCIVCISEAEKQSALKRKICKAEKLQVIYNGVDVKAYEKMDKDNKLEKKEVGIPEDSFVVGMVGRLSLQKAPDIFVKAAEILKEKIPSAFFIIVGSGEMKEEIQRYAKKKNLSESLLLTGWIEDPMPYVNLFDVAVLLSRWEGFGLVLPEYMMAGKPIVATNVDAIPEVCTSDVGILVESDNAISASKAILKLYDDTELRKKLGKNGIKKVKEKFTIDRVANETQEMIEKLITGPAK